MTSTESLERTCLVSDRDPKKYSLAMSSTNLLQNAANKKNHNKESVDLESSSLPHCHDHAATNESKRRERQQANHKLYMASLMCLIFMIAEIIVCLLLLCYFNEFDSKPGIDFNNSVECYLGGFTMFKGGRIAGSLAVMMDAAHMSVDFMSFLISLFSLWLSSKCPSKRLTYGWLRAEILGALLSVVTIWAVTGVLTYSAVLRLLHPQYEIQVTAMLITSGFAVIANMILSLMLYQTGHRHVQEGHPATFHLSQYKSCSTNASVRAAFIHAIGDLIQSLSVLISALIIFIKPEYKMADSICTFLFSFFVLATTITISWDILLVVMEGTPKGLSYDAVKEKILAVDKVKSVHDLHLWSLTMNQAVLTAHIVTVDTADRQQTLKETTAVLFDAYNFHTVTLQIEPEAAQKPGCVFCQDPRN